MRKPHTYWSLLCYRKYDILTLTAESFVQFCTQMQIVYFYIIQTPDPSINAALTLPSRTRAFFNTKRPGGGVYFCPHFYLSSLWIERADFFFRDGIFCKKVQEFWLQQPDILGAPKIGLFQSQTRCKKLPSFILGKVKNFQDMFGRA